MTAPAGPMQAAEMPSGVPRLSVRGATKRFGAVLALDRVDLYVRAGEVLASAAMTRELDVARYIAPSRHRMSLKGFDEPMDAAVVQRAR